MFVLKLPHFFVRLFGERKHATNSKQTISFRPSSRSYIVLALRKLSARSKVSIFERHSLNILFQWDCFHNINGWMVLKEGVKMLIGLLWIRMRHLRKTMNNEPFVGKVVSLSQLTQLVRISWSYLGLCTMVKSIFIKSQKDNQITLSLIPLLSGLFHFREDKYWLKCYKLLSILEVLPRP